MHGLGDTYIYGFGVTVELCRFKLVVFGNGFGVVVQGIGVGVAKGFEFRARV